MAPIPKAIRDKLSKQERMKKCCYCGSRDDITWNHALQFRNRQIQEEYSIWPLCRLEHQQTYGSIKKEAKDLCELLAITMGLEDLRKKYGRFDWLQRKNYLTKKLYESRQ